MNTQAIGRFACAGLLGLAILLAPQTVVAAASRASLESSETVSFLLEQTGINRGVCSVLGRENGDEALELTAHGGFVVNLLDSDKNAVEGFRRKAGELGLYGKSLTADISPINKLPYVDNLIDLLVSAHPTDGQLERLSLDEILRVLRPGGKAVIGGTGTAGQSLKQWAGGNSAVEVIEHDGGHWAVITGPPVPGAADWPHWEHGPDNNPLSEDTALRAPYMTQFMGLPYFMSMPAITTVAGGITFTAVGHIAHHRREEPTLNTLLAQNGYNGTELWRRRFPDGYLVHRSAFVATDSAFIMINSEGNGCLLLDPNTGEEIDRIRVPRFKGEWKWIAVYDGVLYALLGSRKDPPQTHVVRSKALAWSWGDLSSGYYEERVPWGFGQTILAYDMQSGQLLWSHTEDDELDSRAMVIGDGRLYFYGPDSRLGCLDAKTGALEWANDDPELRRLIEQPGQGLTSTPGYRTSCLSLYSPKALFYQGQTRMNVVGVSTADGRLLWHRPKTSNNPNMLYVEDKLLVGIGPNGNNLLLDPLTGETIEDLGFSKHNCVRLTATADSYFCRGWGDGLLRYDRHAKKVFTNGAVRASCNDGALPANGLLYLGPWACDCNLSLVGRVVMCSAGEFDFKPAAASQRLEARNTGSGKITPLEVTQMDWPSYRATTARNAASRASVSVTAEPIWEYTPGSDNLPTAPTAAGGLIFVGGDDCGIQAFDAASGNISWSFKAGGSFKQPPTIWQGRAYAGCGDGYVYALEAATGKLLWRFRAAPIERRTMIYGNLGSTWPVHSGVLIQDGVAYLAAGIVDYDGTYVYALDALTGKLIWQNTSSGHLDPDLRKGVSAQGTLTIADGRLWMPGGNVVSPASYNLKTGEYMGESAGDGGPRRNRGSEIGVVAGRYLLLGGGLKHAPVIDDTKPGKYSAFDLSQYSGSGNGMELTWQTIPPAWDEGGFYIVHGLFNYVWDKRTSPENRPYLIPAAYGMDNIEDYLDRGAPEKEWPGESWSAGELDGSETVSLALAANAVVAVCQTPFKDQRNPQWSVNCLDRKSGKLLWSHRLSSPALPGGLLIDRDGRVAVTLRDGGVVCFGGV